MIKPRKTPSRVRAQKDPVPCQDGVSSEEIVTPHIPGDDPGGLTSQELALMDYWAAWLYMRESAPDVRDASCWN